MAPLPMCVGDVTDCHVPLPSNAASAGMSPCSMSLCSSVGSAASMPMARTRLPEGPRTEQLLGVDPRALRRGSNARFEHGHRLQVVARAGVGRLAVEQRALHLPEEHALLRHLTA